MKKIVVVLSTEAKESFDELNKKAVDSKIDASILKSIKTKIEFIKTNPMYGDPVQKNLIPKEYVEKYGINNLFHVELASFWRMDYTLKNNGDQIEIIAFVLNIFDHKKYNQKYGYKKN